MRCKYCRVITWFSKVCKECKKLVKSKDMEAPIVLEAVREVNMSTKEFIVVRKAILTKSKRIKKAEEKQALGIIMQKYPEEPIMKEVK